MRVGAGSNDVALSVKGGVADIRIDRPERRNALSFATWRALHACVAAAEADSSARVIMIAGGGGNFGAGNDLAAMAELAGDSARAEQFGFAMAEAIDMVESASKPVIMAIRGACYGASVALALAGDLRFAADDATFAITPAKLGALYLRSDLHRLAAAVGSGQARKLIYSAEPISAERAERIGLVDEVLRADRYEQQLADFIGAVLRGSDFTLRRTKEMLRGVTGPPGEDRISMALFVEATQGADFAEGVSAFLERRSPRFD